MTQELRRLAEAADSAMTYEREWEEFKKAANPAAILELLDRLEKAEKDAAPKALEPLTVEEIERIHQRYGGDMVNCTRAIERHHGITKCTP